jgi:predicted metalloenzyme YecM
MDQNTFEKLANTFLEKTFQHISNNNIDLKNWSIDHICYRCSSNELYLEMKEIFLTLGDLLTEGDVNGRLISTFRLNTPINFRHYTIPLLELPAPKAGKVNPDGFEHIEFVVEDTFETILQQYPGLKFKTSGMSKSFNPELCVQFPHSSIKFHHMSLDKVIEIETSS